MKIVTKYITTSFIISFVATLIVLTFVMSLGAVFKVTDLIARGAPWRPILMIFLNSIPTALSLAIPISTLVSSLLVFGRFSSDGEITAMRACGLSSTQIIVGPLTVSVVLAALCIYVNNVMMPRGHFQQRSAITELGMESPLALIEEGRFIQDFPGMTVYIGNKKGNQLSDVRIYDNRKRGVNREIRAKGGAVNVESNGTDLALDLYDVRVDPITDDKPWAAQARRYTMKIENAGKKRVYVKKETDLFFGELVDYIRDIAAHYPQLAGKDVSIPRMSIAVEMNKRLVLSLSCIAFVLLGVPLGVKAHRKESSIGVAISLFLVFNFYLFVIIAETLVKKPELRPDLIIWVPVLLFAELGIVLLRRLT